MRSDPRGDIEGSPRRLWIEFEQLRPPGVPEGGVYVLISDPPPRVFGVTGLDAADCHELVRESLPDQQLPAVRSVVWDVDVSSLEILPTLIGNPAERGVWFAGPSFFAQR